MSRTLEPEDRISHYRIVGPVGAGGMGEVYLAFDLTLERNVAFKVLPRELVRNEERVRRFMLEAKSASSLNHPNIVTIYEIGQDVVRGPDGEPSLGDAEPVHFIAMELVSGETLGRKIHEEKEDLRTLLGVMAQAAEGLAKAHASGIVHRDLKPANIMVSKDGYAKILDFGLAKLTERQGSGGDQTTAPTALADNTGVGMVLGTIGYMSPEQVQAKGVDHRSDIFSFGCILYEAATRRRPFIAETDIDTMHKIIHDKPKDIDELNPKTPTELRRLIRRCLAKNPDQRLQSMKDLAIELREIVEEYDSLSASSPSGSSTRAAMEAPPPARRGLPLPVIAGVVLIGVAGIAFGLFGLLKPRTAPRTGSTAFQSMQMTSLMSRPDLLDAVISGDGRYLAYLVGPIGKWSLWVRQVATGSDVQILPPQGDEINGISFSPDGNYVYYLNRDPDAPNYRALFEIPSLGGAPRKRAFDVDTAASFSPDGRQVCFRRGAPQNGEDHLIVFNLDTSQERKLAVLKSPRIFDIPVWSPDGKKIAASTSTNDGFKSEVITFDAADGRQSPVGTDVWTLIGRLAWLAGGKGLVFGQASPGQPGQLWRLSFPDGHAERVTNDLNDYANVSVSADGRTLSTLQRSRTSNIWIAGPDVEGGVHQLTFGAGSQSSVGNVSPAPDGSIRLDAPSPEGRLTIQSIGRDGGNRRSILSGPLTYANPEVLGSGDGIVFMTLDAVTHIWRSDLDGGNPVQLTNGKGEFLQAVSPDGGTVLFYSSENVGKLWAVSTKGGEPSLAAEGSQGWGEYSRDGRFIAYSNFRTREDGLIQSQIAVVPAGGGAPKTIVTPRNSDDWEWTPDGRTFACIASDHDAQNIVRIDPAGGPAVPITRFEDGKILEIEYSRDGGTIFFYRRVGSTDNVWKVPAEGGEPVPLTNFSEGQVFEIKPSWDGKSVVFLRGDTRTDVVLIRNFMAEM